MRSPRFVVRGGRPLSGTVRPAGNKNAALPILAATLLGESPSEIANVPRIRDVDGMLQLLEQLGCRVAWTGENTVRVDPTGAAPQALDRALAAQLRASVLLAGPGLARFGRIVLPPPGGDVIGRRRLDTHLLALEGLGAQIDVGVEYTLEARSLVGTDLFLDEPSVTGTENALMAAASAEGVTTIMNAAQEPHVQDLARFLVAMGARIDGIGTSTYRVEGTRPLSGTSFTIGPDHVEVGSFIGLAAATEGELTIEGVRTADLRSMLLGFARLGVTATPHGDRLLVGARQERRIRADFGGHVPKLEDGPWPAFPADLMSIALVVATQCEGLLLVFEKMFESRLFFVDKLIGMGARIILCDPHRALVAGPSRLRGGVVDSPDIRAGMAILVAACAAEGVSTIHNVGQIERGYERIHQRVKALGGDIERIEDGS